MRIIKKTAKSSDEIKNNIRKYAEKKSNANWSRNAVFYKIRKKSFMLVYHRANLSAPTRTLYCKIYETKESVTLKGIITSIILDPYEYLFLFLFSGIIPILSIVFEFLNVKSFDDFKTMIITALVLHAVIFILFTSFVLIISLISQILPLKNQEKKISRYAQENT